MLRIALGRAWTAEVSAQTSSDPNLTPTHKQSIRFHVPTDITSQVSNHRTVGTVSMHQYNDVSDLSEETEYVEKPRAV